MGGALDRRDGGGRSDDSAKHRTGLAIVLAGAASLWVAYGLYITAVSRAVGVVVAGVAVVAFVAGSLIAWLGVPSRRWFLVAAVLLTMLAACGVAMKIYDVLHGPVLVT